MKLKRKQQRTYDSAANNKRTETNSAQQNKQTIIHMNEENIQIYNIWKHSS